MSIPNRYIAGLQCCVCLFVTSISDIYNWEVAHKVDWVLFVIVHVLL